MEDDQDIDSGSEADGAIDSGLFGAVDIPKGPAGSAPKMFVAARVDEFPNVMEAVPCYEATRGPLCSRLRADTAHALVI